MTMRAPPDNIDPSHLAPPEEYAVAAAAGEIVANVTPSIIKPILANTSKKTSRC